MFRQLCCSSLAQANPPSTRSTPNKAALAALSARLSTNELMDYKLSDKNGLRSQQAAPPHFGVELADRSQQAAPPHGVELATEQQVQQVAPPLSGVEQTEPKDEIAAIFDESVRSLKAFSGELLHDFKHRLGRDRASSLPARGDQDRAPDGHLGKPATQQKRTRRRGGRRGETRRAAHRTAREEATQARANIKEATDCTDSEARQRGRGERRPGSVADSMA